MTSKGDAARPRPREPALGRPRTGLADLARAMASGGPAARDAAAAVLGYARSDGHDQAAPAGQGKTGIRPRLVPEPKERWAPVRLWRLDSVRPAADGPPPRSLPAGSPLTRADLVRRPGEAPARLPIVPPAVLRAALERMLATRTESRRLDLGKLVDQLARGEVMDRLPRRAGTGWTRRLTILVDRGRRLTPFWDDQDEAIDLIERRLGTEGVRVAATEPGASLRWRFEGERGRELPDIDPAGHVLALTDLGALGTAAERAAWRTLGQVLRGERCTLRALVPCPARRWHGAPARLWNAVDWSRPSRASRRDALSEEQRHTWRERLLTRIAPAFRIEPALLRHIRRAAGDAGDLGTEADVWRHPSMARFGCTAGQLDPEAHRARRLAFRDLDADTKGRIVACLERFRRGQPMEGWLQEVVALAQDEEIAPQVAGDHAAAERLIARLLPTAQAAGDPAMASAIRTFTQQVGRTLPWQALDTSVPLVATLRNAFDGTRPAGERKLLPPGAGPDPGPGEAVSHTWAMVQAGDRVVLGAQVDDTNASPLGVLDAGRAAIKVGDGFRPETPLDPQTTIPLPDADTLTLRTDRTVATLRRITQPTWANAMGRDRIGLWATFEVKGVTQRLRWIPPGCYMMGSPEDEPGRADWEMAPHERTIEHGFWLADTACTQVLWQAVMGKNPSRFHSPDRPVEQVSFEEVKAYLERLNEVAPGLDARLPKEVEWEYACRAGTDTATYVGPIAIEGVNDAPVLDAIAWYGGNSGVEFELEEHEDSSGWPEKQHDHTRAGTHPVATKDPNPWGLYDMLGNVYEWCDEVWSEDHDAQREGTLRVIRGGSSNSFTRSIRAASRDFVHPSLRWDDLGFRLARGQGALRQGAERQVKRAEPASGGAERMGGGAR